MFGSLKTLVENRLKSLLQLGAARQAHWKLAAPTYSADLTLLDAFHSLQAGGVSRLAPSGSVAWEESCLSVGARDSVAEPMTAAADPEAWQAFLQEHDIQASGPFEFPEQNPITLQAIDWNREICRDNLEQLSRASLRAAKCETLSQDAKLNRLVHLMFLALRSGNISLAMMLFSHLEANTANEITRSLMQKVQALQDNKRKLAQDLQNQKTDAEGSKNMQKIKTEMEQANDDIAVLQTFIRDVAQNKQASLELANAFISKEHETTMAIVRSFGR